MERGTGTYNIGGGVDVSLNEAIAHLERISGRTLSVRRAPAVAGDQRRTRADTTKAEKELGWRPTVALEQGLSAQWEWAATRLPNA
jgi:nucleoside-diphosphate-sugar epimerase